MTPPAPSAARTTLTARSPEDLLAAAAVVLGFWPTDSAVMLTFGARHPFHARVDLPDDPTDRADVADLAESLARPASQHGATRVVLLLYDDRSEVAAAWTALRAAFRERGIEVVEAIHVAADRWFPLLGGEPGRRTAGVGYSRDRLGAHRFVAQSVLDGRVTHDSRADLAATLEPDPEAVSAIAVLAADRIEPDDLRAEGTWANALLRRHLEAGTRADDGDAARLLVGMRRRPVRDAAWSAIERRQARAAIEFLADLARRTPPDLRAPVAALLGWAAWQAGDGALAWCAIDRCREVDPGYSLAHLVSAALEHALPPTMWTEDVDWTEGLDVG